MAQQERGGAAHRIVAHKSHDYSSQQQPRDHAPLKRAEQVAEIEKRRSSPAHRYAVSQIRKKNS